jgi:hypothetical protein
MTHPSQLQFRFLPPEAKQAALQRLALRGCDLASISAQTGLPEGEIRRHLFQRAPAMPAVSAAHGLRRSGYNARLLELAGAASGSAA